MTRNPLAVPFSLYDGQVTLWYMPYTTLLNNVVQQKFEQIVPRYSDTETVLVPAEVEGGEPTEAKKELWGEYETAFVMIEANVIDAEFAPELCKQAQVWKTYWSARTGDLANNWQVYTAVAALFLNLDFWRGWNATRDHDFDGDALLAKPVEGAAPQS